MKHGTSEFGEYVHKILELYEKEELESYELLPYYEEHYNEEVISSFLIKINENFSKNFETNYYESGKEYLKNFDGFPDWEILEVEYDFKLPVEGKFYFRGKVDLVAKDKNGKLLIIDHKSKNGFKNKKEQHTYLKQLYLYSFAIYHKYGKFPDILGFNIFRKNKILLFDFNPIEYGKAMGWLKHNVKKIEAEKDYCAIPHTFYCNNFCEWREICTVKNNL